jgi:glycosyltransferase involved in cell wall biosynthesis
MELSERLEKKRIVLAANIVDGYPSEFEYTRDFLLRNGANELFTISSPLQRRSRSRTVLRSYKNGVLVRTISIRRPNFPPITYIFDFLLVLLRKRYDLWIGFNPIMSAIGALSSRNGTLANWAIDFVPQRGEGGLAEKFYRRLERHMMKRIRVQIENTPAARDARVAAHRINPPIQLIAPIGVWSNDYSPPSIDQFSRRRIVYFGSIDERNGAPYLERILRVLVSKHQDVVVEIIGAGSSEELMTSLAREFPQQVIFHGYKEEQNEVNEILRNSAIALAPYEESTDAFTAFADPQKLKYYAANGLPVVLTNVAPAAQIMSDLGAAIILSQSSPPEEWVDVVMHLLNDEHYWFSAAQAAYDYSKRFDRELVYANTFSEIFNVLD